jgi:3-oxoacyl-[acyl-carrier protein] reductase
MSLINSNTTSNGQADKSRIEARKRILVAGASGDIGCALMRLLAQGEFKIGAHYRENSESLKRLVNDYPISESHIKLYEADLRTQKSCHALVDSFIEWAGGIDGLVQLTGNVRRPCRWEDLTEEDWLDDISVNLSGPFFLAQQAMKYMKATGGRIILTSTASAKHGGGKNSMAYGVAKAGVECLAKGLARDGAPYDILVNVVAPGFIETQFHGKRMGRNHEDLKKRAELVPLKRAGRPEDVALLIVHLLSSGGDFITGECIAVSGGDWL